MIYISAHSIIIFFLFCFLVKESVFFARKKGLHPLNYRSRFTEIPNINCFQHLNIANLPAGSLPGLCGPQLPWTPPGRKALDETGTRACDRAPPALRQGCTLLSWDVFLEHSRYQQALETFPCRIGTPCKYLHWIMERKHSRGRFFSFTAWVREHVSQRISSDVNHPNKHGSSRHWDWRHCSINSMPSKRLIQEQTLHQMYSFRPKVTFQWLLYWRRYSLCSSYVLVLHQAPSNSRY